MKDLNLALRDMASRADEQLMPDPHTMREHVAPASRRRRRIRSGAWGAAAASVAVVIGVGLSSLDADQPAPAPVDGPKPGRPTPAPPAMFDLETEPYGEEQGWRQFPLGEGVSWTALAYRNDRYVAVADTSTADFVGDNATAAGAVPIWWSADGRTWTRVEDDAGPESVNVWTVLAVDDGFVALAVDPRGRTRPWLSEDGRAWRPSGSRPAGPGPTGLIDTDLGLVAWGRGRVWISTDGGRSWATASQEPIWPPVRYRWNPCWIEPTDNGLRALVIRKGGGPGGTGVHWTSADALTWNRAGEMSGPPLAACIKHDDDASQATGAPGIIAIEPNDDRYDNSIFFRPAEQGR